MTYSYSVGQIIEKFKGSIADVPLFDLADDTGILIVVFNRPNANEVEQFKSGHNFEIRMTEMYGVIMISAKI